MYTSRVRAACTIEPYNNGSGVPIRLSGRESCCLEFVKSAFFRLGLVPQEKPSHLFNPVFIQEQDLHLEMGLWSLLIYMEKGHCGSGYTGLYLIYVTLTVIHVTLNFMFVLNRKESFFP